MRTLLLLLLLLMLVPPGQNSAQSDDGSSVVVTGHKWTKSRQAVKKIDVPVTGPAAAVSPGNKPFERNARAATLPPGARDPYADTLDARSAALEKSVQESRTPQPKPVDGFSYQVKIQNASQKVIEIVFLEYQFTETSNPNATVRRQFLCAVKIKPDKEKELLAFSPFGPSEVISVESLGKKSANLFQEKVVINRVEYADGSIWQRRDWNFAEIRSSLARAVGTPWGSEMCRGL